MDAKNNTTYKQQQQQQQQHPHPLTTPSGKRSTAAAVFKSHHVVRNADIVDVASDASLYCGGTENEIETDAQQQQQQHAVAATTQQEQQQQQQPQQLQPQPTPRAAPRAAGAVNAPPTPKPRQAVKSSSKGSTISFDLLFFSLGGVARVARGSEGKERDGAQGSCNFACHTHTHESVNAPGLANNHG